MAPEVADGLPYNFKADVYSFGIILWELVAGKKPFEGLSRDLFYERVVHGGERPIIRSKWPKDLSTLMSQCWDADISNRPRFREIAARLSALLENEKGGNPTKPKRLSVPILGNMIDRHSTWF
jgi:serine/threonine protein kinase